MKDLGLGLASVSGSSAQCVKTGTKRNYNFGVCREIENTLIEVYISLVECRINSYLMIVGQRGGGVSGVGVQASYSIQP